MIQVIIHSKEIEGDWESTEHLNYDLAKIYIEDHIKNAKMPFIIVIRS